MLSPLNRLEDWAILSTASAADRRFPTANSRGEFARTGSVWVRFRVLAFLTSSSKSSAILDRETLAEVRLSESKQNEKMIKYSVTKTIPLTTILFSLSLPLSLSWEGDLHCGQDHFPLGTFLNGGLIQSR